MISMKATHLNSQYLSVGVVDAGVSCVHAVVALQSFFSILAVGLIRP